MPESEKNYSKPVVPDTVKKPRVLLIQSKTEFQSELTHHPFLPLGLLSIATPLKDEFSVSILDQRASEHFKEELAARLEEAPIGIGITCLTGKQIRYALEISQYIREKSKVPIIWGGCHPTSLPEQTVRDPAIDMVMQGEADISFRDLVRAISCGDDLGKVTGLWYKEGERIQKGEQSQPPDLDGIPMPDYSLVDVRDYLMYRKVGGTLPVETSRGCPSGCRFCHCSGTPGWRKFPIERVVDNVEYLVRHYKAKSIMFVDDNFFVDIDRARELLERLLSKGLRPHFEIQGVRADTLERMDDEYFTFMERAGVAKLDIGVESGSPKILNFINKGITPDQVRRVNMRLKEYAFMSQYNFMGGFPTETREDIKKTLQLMFNLMNENPRAIVSWMHIYSSCPNTKLHEWEVRTGLIHEPGSLKDWADFDRQLARSRPLSWKERRLLEHLYFATHFLDKKATYYFQSRILQILYFLYRPIARFRVRTLYFGFMIEKFIFDRLAQRIHRKSAL